VKDSTDQVSVWKDVEARDTEATEHPSGEVTLPKARGQLARANALAGYMIGLAIVTPVVPTLSYMSTCRSL
jgi:hypothetical protein